MNLTISRWEREFRFTQCKNSGLRGEDHRREDFPKWVISQSCQGLPSLNNEAKVIIMSKESFFKKVQEIDYGRSGTELVLCFYWYSWGNYWDCFCVQTNPPSSLYGIMTASLPSWQLRLADVEAKLWSVGVCMVMVVNNS